MTQIIMMNADEKSFLILKNPRHLRSIVKLKILFIFLFGLGFSTISNAQQSNLYLNQEYSSYLDKGLNNPQSSLHTGFKPLIQADVNRYVNSDSLNGYVFPAEKKSWLYRKLYQENLFIIHDSASKFYCTIDPLFNFQASINHSDSNKKYIQNTRGILVQGNIGNHFAFSSTFWENQASFPPYLNQFIQESYVVPGYGRTKSFGANEYDFSMSEAYLSFSPSSHFNFQGGYGKNFIGDGYRSLLLSDNSFAYPYIRITTTYWHLQYTNLYTQFQDPFANPGTTVGNIEGVIQRKAGAFQYLSWNIVPQVELGVFQGIIWTAADPYNHQSFNAYYFNPVIGVSALRYGLNNTNNVLLGSTLKYKINKNFMAYGQLLIDKLPSNGNMHSIYNQTGYQAGIKYFNKFGEFQLEYNQVRPYAYSSKDSLQNYSHYDQALGDPLGANFRELIGIMHLRYHHFSLNLQGNYALEGLDSASSNYGNNIFLPTPTNTGNVAMLQGIKSTLTYMDAHISYLMNPRTNMNFTIGVSRRALSNDVYKEPTATLFYIGFRTSIENMYLDF